MEEETLVIMPFRPNKMRKTTSNHKVGYPEICSEPNLEKIMHILPLQG